MYLHVDILKKVCIFCVIFWFVKNFHLSEILRKTAEISAPSIFQGIQIFFAICHEDKKQFLVAQKKLTFCKKIIFEFAA